MAAPTTPVFLTPAQLAELYPVSLSTIYANCLAGAISHYRIPAKKGKRGKYLIKLADFLAWLESHRHEAGEVKADGELKYL